MKLNKTTLCLALTLASSYSTTVMANDIATALSNGKATVDLNLRYENVDQDNALKTASALTLHTRLSYATGEVNGFSSLVEFEDSRNVLGIDDYNNTLGKNTDHSVIADPESTEVDQMLLQYKQESFTAKLGRQVITMDNHRFVGHVGWRQDRQTFDGITFDYNASENLSFKYGYITQRNRIFADGKDIDSKDHLFNAAYKTQAGTISAYSYLLEVDNNSDNALDTYGIRFNGATQFDKQKITFAFDYAIQDADASSTSYSSNYLLAEVGTTVSGLGFKVGYELLGSDDGMYGFSTPLATLHKFNGWSDQFLATPKEGLSDIYVSIGGKAVGGKWAVIYHNFNADEASDTVDDFGSEINAVYTKKFSKHYTAGIKFSAYSAGDPATGKVDTDKLWLWVNAKF
ncbi:alginate export family protein [Colwellia sp. 1_MG-2023]|uniref:alginate export family protein n=1 Tax=Colwellia sp. 1_MG-2023 TaxID=3062649 RepID=UPI0026E39367|nr:alginate export family protein [Colwellia sp. 1_MG-2023]MDO6445628.1 alginate export family protein [Colwellia sp. 1_MG-2023]